MWGGADVVGQGCRLRKEDSKERVLELADAKSDDTAAWSTEATWTSELTAVIAGTVFALLCRNAYRLRH